ncbi:hypothetical protein BH09BAC5_BH09BAC5_27900 [soil metagenome]
MKNYRFVAILFSIAVFGFCCKSVKNNFLPTEEVLQDNEVSAYLHSADGVMHNSPTPSKKGTTVSDSSPSALPKAITEHSLHLTKSIVNDLSAAVKPEMTKKEKRKAIKAVLKQNLKEGGDDGEVWGIAIGLLILFVLLGILILVLLYYLIAYAVHQNTNTNNNNNSSGSGSSNSGSNSGCYVATMVYGSYDAPEVLVLRRFRDEKLNHSKAGRAFVRWYYRWSPPFVEKYHHLNWLHKIIKPILNQLVRFLS